MTKRGVKYAVWVLCLATLSNLAQADPVPRVPPGCRSHCLEYTKAGGHYNGCVLKCPSVEVCLKAMAMTDHTELYTDPRPGLPDRPKPCKNHCWSSTVYTMHSCMVDCPETFCRLHGDVIPTTTTTTTTTTMTPTVISGPKIQSIVDGSADSTGTANKEQHNTNNAAIGLSVLAVCGFIVVTVIVIVVAYRRYKHKKAVRRGAHPATSTDTAVVHLRS